ncbi:hypothetical protein JVU11DRAFT_1859 [Chiua virens]|nr:hypothetical protein JVU11DRAFT_1859 [Chiua virens]
MILVLEIDLQSSDSSALDETRSTASISSKANASTHSNDDTFMQSFDTIVSISNKVSNQVKKESPPPQAALYPSHSITTIPHHQSGGSPMNIKHVTQAGSMAKVKSWEAILKYIHKQLQNYELFGDKIVFSAKYPDFLTLLKQIDQRKNWVTYQEEQATNLAYNIKEILVNNARVVDRESEKLAVQIVDNFDQRFRNQRYYGPRG